MRDVVIGIVIGEVIVLLVLLVFICFGSRHPQ